MQETTAGFVPPNGALKASTSTGVIAHAKVVALRANLEARFLERTEEIKGLLVAALAGEHVLLLGPPGTGKSALARAFADALGGASYFEWLLTRFSTPEELYGPVSLSGLKSDRFRRVTAGKLPEAHVAFLDEIFKANSAVLNSLLAAINERIFHDDGAARAIPLLTCIAASNEMPESVELAALWDRFVLRYSVAYTKAEDSFLAMLGGATPAPLKGTISLADWSAARAEVDAMPVSKETLRAMFALRGTLEKAGVTVSDRRWVKALSLLRANAWLSGAKAVSTFHLEILRACLWNTEDQQQTVWAEVMKLAAAEVMQAEKIASTALGLLSSLPDPKQKEFTERAASVRQELKKALGKVEDLKKNVSDPGAVARIEQVEAQITAEGKSLSQRIKASIDIDF